MLVCPRDSKTSTALQPMSPKPRITEQVSSLLDTASSRALVARFSIDSVVWLNPNSRRMILLAEITWSKNELLMSLTNSCFLCKATDPLNCDITWSSPIMKESKPLQTLTRWRHTSNPVKCSNGALFKDVVSNTQVSRS